MNRFADHCHRVSPHDLTFLAGVPCVYHCHHFNLFHDQTIDDVLGESAGFDLRMRVARDQFGLLVANLAAKTGATLPAEIAALARSVFATMGQGNLAFEGIGASTRATGEHLHYGFAWREKYGARVRRVDPSDAVASGMTAAVARLTGPDNVDYLGRELQCVSMRAPSCQIVVERDARPDMRSVIAAPQILPRLPSQAVTGLDEDVISNITAGLDTFLRGVGGDERGLIDAFGVLVTHHLSGYYNETAFQAVRHVEAISPSVAGACEELLREAGHVCVFNTFGNILLSPEWEGLVGRPTGDPHEIVRGCTAIARGLGFGHWAIAEHAPGKRLVLRTSSNYEAAHWLERFGPDTRSREYFMQGAALAFMVLSQRVRWSERPQLTQAFYDQLFRGDGLGYRVSTPRSLTMGDELTEVVVEQTR
ncbi:MAG: hypothetical protein K1X94_33980 [Sandaracinaceae bacterium]|nr:hypothetical protein [Sandaracinaceae bacterium]